MAVCKTKVSTEHERVMTEQRSQTAGDWKEMTIEEPALRVQPCAVLGCMFLSRRVQLPGESITNASS